MRSLWSIFFFFFFNDTATTEIYTLSLHDALPISEIHPDPLESALRQHLHLARPRVRKVDVHTETVDRKSTRLNSSHSQISYAVFCLKKKNKIDRLYITTQCIGHVITSSTGAALRV